MKPKPQSKTSEEGRLCYVSGTTAWFTTQDLRAQWGDDWGTPGMEKLAGLPYRYTKYDREDGLSPWEISSLEFGGEFLLPFDPPGKTKWSVAEVNAGACPWLRGRDPAGTLVEIPAGVTKSEFLQLLERVSPASA